MSGRKAEICLKDQVVMTTEINVAYDMVTNGEHCEIFNKCTHPEQSITVTANYQLIGIKLVPTNKKPISKTLISLANQRCFKLSWLQVAIVHSRQGRFFPDGLIVAPGSYWGKNRVSFEFLPEPPYLKVGTLPETEAGDYFIAVCQSRDLVETEKASV